MAHDMITSSRWENSNILDIKICTPNIHVCIGDGKKFYQKKFRNLKTILVGNNNTTVGTPGKRGYGGTPGRFFTTQGWVTKKPWKDGVELNNTILVLFDEKYSYW